jgi:hypothetical protein
MELPYVHSRALAMEILRHGSDVEVLTPAALRAEVEAILEQTLALYRAPTVGASQPPSTPVTTAARAPRDG